MLQEFWNYFTTTGQIDTYMNYKAYEEIQNNQNDMYTIHFKQGGTISHDDKNQGISY